MKTGKRWSVAEARREFAGLLRAAEREPQYILRHGEVAAVVVNAKANVSPSSEPVARVKSMKEWLDEIKKVAREEGYTLRTGPRNRWSPEFDRFKRAVSR